MLPLKGLSLEQTIRLWAEVEKLEGGPRYLALHDRYYLLVRILGREDALHPWLYERCREVEESPDNHLDLWAREHYKSTIITFAGAIQEILKDPEITICIFSHTKQIARKFWRQIRYELEANERLKGLFPDILWANPSKEAPRWSEESGLVVKRKSNPKESTLEAHGLVDGQPTSAHYRLRIYDDVVTLESVSTPEQVQKTTDAWALSDNLAADEGRRWHTGTRYSFADTYQSILDRKILVPRVYPATHDGSPDGTPILWTKTKWEEKKLAQGPAIVACQLLQNPIAGAQAMFDPGDLEIYEVRPATLNIYILVDPARSMKKGSANTAMAVIGVDAGGNKYLLDGYNHRMDLKTRWEKLSGLYKVWTHMPGSQQVFVGYEAYGAQADLDYFQEQMQITRNFFPVEELKWPRDSEGSKDDRVQRLGPDFRSHKFYVPYEGPETSNQKKMKDAMQPYRIAKPIRRVDSENNIYDLTKHFREQVTFYPFAPLKDLIDAVSRIYDMEPVAPMIIDQKNLVPEVHADGF